MKFLLFVEGRTEKRSIADFIKGWLDRKLNSPVGISVIQFKGFGEYLKEIKERVELHLSSKNQQQIIAALGLLDLYGPTIFPAELSFSQRAVWGKDHIERQVNNRRFRQHFAVHETEAWLLAHEEILPRVVRDSLPTRCSQPETVNLNEPPSRLLGRLYRDHLNRDYRKTIDGKNLFLKCSPEIVAAKCPHFSRLLTDMEQLAQAAFRR